MSTDVYRLVAAIVAAFALTGGAAASQGDAAHQLAAADAAMQAGRFTDAAHQYEMWLETHPDSQPVLFALGVCYIQLARPRDAVATLRRYVALVPHSASGHAALGIALLDGATSLEARAELETAVTLNPAQVNAIEALARIHLIDGDPAGAVSLLRPLVSSSSERTVGPPLGSARPGSGPGEGPRVRTSLDESLHASETRALFAEALIRSGDPAAAAAILERELAGNSQCPIQTFVLAAWARIKSGDVRRAAEICEQGMRVYPDSEIEGVYLSLSAPVLAERTAARLEHLQASPEVEELIALGRVLTDVDRARKTIANELARRLLSQAIALAPQNASAHYNYGRALRQDSIEGALSEWEKALALHPDDELRLQIFTQIAKSKDALADFTGADQAFRTALAINRTLARHVPEAALEYVRFLQLRPQPAEADTVLTEVLAWNPWSPEAHVERARLLATGAHWDDVITEAEFVLRNAGANGELLRVAHLLLAGAYYRLKQPEKAQVHRSWLETH